MKKKNKIIILSLLLTCILLIIGIKIVNAAGNISRTGKLVISFQTSDGAAINMKGIKIRRIKTDDNGIDSSIEMQSSTQTFSNLPVGSYYIYIDKMPEGYEGLNLSAKPEMGYFVDTAEVTADNTTKVVKKLKKIQQQNTETNGTLTINTMIGVGLKVINNNGNTVYTGKTSSSSTQLSLPQGKTYTVFITSLPDGYNIDEQGLTYNPTYKGYGIGTVNLTTNGATISKTQFKKADSSNSNTKGTLKLKVTNSSSQSIKNVSISIQKNGSTNMNSGETDSNGILEFSNIETGTYNIYLTGGLPEGYNLANQTGYSESTAMANIATVSINSGETVSKDIIIVPAQIETARVTIKSLDETTLSSIGDIDIKLYKKEGESWSAVGNGATYSTSSITGECVLYLPMGTYAINVVGSNNSYPLDIQGNYDGTKIQIHEPLIVSTASDVEFPIKLIPGGAKVIKPATRNDLINSNIGDKLYVYMYQRDVPEKYRNSNPLVYRDGFDEAQILCLNHNTYQKEGYQVVCHKVDILGDTAVIDGSQTISNKAFLKLEYVLNSAQLTNENESEGLSGTQINQNRIAYQKYFWQNKDGGIANLLGFSDWVSSSTWGQSENDLTNAIEAKAEAYANNANNGNAKISTNNSEIEYDEDTIAGPFSAEFVGNIRKIEVKDENGNRINVELYKDRECTQPIGKKNTYFWDISSNQEFYVKSNSERIKSVYIQVQNNVLGARLWFLKPCDVGINEGQNTMSFESIVKSTEANTTITVKEPPVGNLKITKEDTDTHEKLQGAEFILYKYEGKVQGWVTEDSDGKKDYVQSEESAKRFSTNGEGILSINNLKIGNYYLYEVKTPNEKYQISSQDGYDSNKNWITLGSITIQKDKTTEKTVYNRKGGKIIIKKVDESDPSIDLSAGFKLQKGTGNNSWLSGTQAPYSYTTYENATRYTKQVGEALVIEGLEDGTYNLYEVVPPEGYLLRNQEGYDASNDRALVKSNIEISLRDNKNEVEITATNVKKVSISGYVWIEGIPDKGSENDYDSLYTEVDKKVGKDEVIVKLMKKGETIPIATTGVNENGEYLFDSLVKKSEIDNYYIEFDYSSKYKDYIPVEYNKSKINGSKALMYSVPEEDKNLAGIATTYSGTNASDINKYGIAAVANYKELDKNGTSINEYQNINLGLKKIIKPQFSIIENIAYVKIGMKGYDYTYTYGGTGNTSRVAAPRVKWQNSQDIYAYSRDIYPSDIAYDVKNSTQELKVDVTYRIDITNTTNHNIEELYKEQKLYITGLTNNFDTTRYELNDKNWTGNNGTATITDNYKKSIYDNGINTNSTATSYITFSVKHDALLDILNHPNGIIEKNPTKVTAVGHHQYSRKDYSWQNDITKEQTHITSNDTKSADAPYLIFKLGEERILSGKVFEDKVVTTDGQKLGNGVYDENENVVKDVLVELLDINENVTDITKLPVSNLYGVGTDKNAISIPAQVKTDANGNYTLNGIVPGYYYLRFTYGDGTQKIYDISGKEVKNLSAKEYKSTIITNDIVKQALKDGKDFEWYRKINNANASVAIDNLNTRIAVNAGTQNSKIMAGTARIFIKIENTGDNLANIEVNENGQIALTENRFNGLNLGLIELPKQNAEIEKIITNIKLSNAQGNVLYNGNPENISTQGAGAVTITDLDDKQNGGSSYVRAEMVENSLYGSNLELTYDVRITNTSDINYYNNQYYWYGEANRNKEISLTPTTVKDYLDETLKYDAENVKTDKARIEEVDPNKLETITVEENDIKVQEFNLKGWQTIYTNKITNRDEGHPTTDKVTLVANRKLTKEDNDMEIVSRAEIKTIEQSTDINDKDTDKEEQIKIAPKEVHTNGMEKATFSITPPTGENRNIVTIYAIAGIVSLLILSTGIVVIKKKIQ